MAPMAGYTHASSYEQSLHSAALELKYERGAHLVDLIAKDESIRKLRFEVHVLEDDADELRDLLAKEEDRSDALERLVNAHLARAEDAEASVQELDQDLQIKEQELSSLRAEAKALRNITTDASKNLTERLHLTAELSQLKPELEHLRSQVAANQDTLADKLALQRQVSELQVELEHSKREAQRALAKRRNTQHDFAQEDEIDTLQKSMTREKRLREKAEEALEQVQADLDDARRTAQRNTVTETKKVEQDAQQEVRSEELSRELASERKERVKAEKGMHTAQANWEAQKSILDDKLSQFRTKLKSTKEKLKETETALAEAQAAAAPKQANKASAAAKPSKKRNAAQMEPDATNLGTPGDAAPAKRGRKAAGVGEKSSFSITPFLNRTMSVAPESPEDGEKVKESEAEAEHSPTLAKTSTTKKQPLAPITASKSNIKKAPASRKKVVLSTVTEEDESSQRPKTVPLKDAADESTLKPKQSSKPKVRKSLAAFASFNLETEAETRSKKRKLGGLGKTLFDDEDDAPRALPGRGLFGGVRLGPLGGLGAAKGSFLVGGGGLKAGLMATADGFQFSPLKKEKRMMSFIK